jgi:hypothetical protein
MDVFDGVAHCIVVGRVVQHGSVQLRHNGQVSTQQSTMSHLQCLGVYYPYTFAHAHKIVTEIRSTVFAGNPTKPNDF